jgi:hypothetical protein
MEIRLEGLIQNVEEVEALKEKKKMKNSSKNGSSMFNNITSN